MFGGDGRLRGAAPGLFGSAVGDHTAPGIAGLALREIPGRDRTTPAGRFVGGYGPSIDAGRVLWVDYEFRVSTTRRQPRPAEKRAERLAPPTPDDTRVTTACINVSPDSTSTSAPDVRTGGVCYSCRMWGFAGRTFPEFERARSTKTSPEMTPGPR